MSAQNVVDLVQSALIFLLALNVYVLVKGKNK